MGPIALDERGASGRWAGVLENEPGVVEARALAWQQYDGSARIEMVHGQRLSLVPGDDYSRTLFVYRRQHVPLFLALARLHLESAEGVSSVCWDVGANIGYVSALLSTRSDVRQVVSIEPHAGAYAALVTNSGFYPKISPIQLLVGNRTGEEYHYRNARNSAHSMSSGGVLVPQTEVEHVADRLHMTTVDNLSAEMGLPVNLLKIDVEGGEAGVLMGAARSIRESRPVMVIEFHRENRASISAALRSVIPNIASSFRLLFANMAGEFVEAGELESVPTEVTDIVLVPHSVRIRT